MEISCALTTTLESPAHAEVAEQLGYRRAWFYDNPPLSPDIWMILGLAAQRTSRIGLGPAVLNPGLRHPMVNAAGTAGLVALAPGRVCVAFGTGFGMRVVGSREVKWALVEEYVNAFRGLLRGETVTWQGGTMRMLHGELIGQGMDVPVVISAIGPKGAAVARRIADGLFVVGAAPPTFAKEHEWVAALCHGVVLDEDEDTDSDRVRLVAGPGVMAPYHFLYPSREGIAQLPGGEAWLRALDEHPEDERHLAAYAGHFIELNEADEAAWRAGAKDVAEHLTMTARTSSLRARLAGLAEMGVTEVVYQPSGPDIPRELERFRQASK